jgi:hypothetical protein
MKNRIYGNGFLILSLGMAALFFAVASTASAGQVQLPKDKSISVAFDPGANISSGKLNKGDTVKITLAESIEIGGAPIVEKGATGKAVVTEVKKAGWMHKKGYIKIEFVELNAKGEFRTPAGAKIKLSGAVEKKGGLKFFPSMLPLLIGKGGQASIKGGGVYAATIKESIILESK